MAEKRKYWSVVLYPENMVDDWQDSIGDRLQIPYCYAIHDQDVDSESNERKVHVHLILAFSNTTTYNNACSVLSSLNKDTLIIDLASAPGGVDVSAAKRLSSRVLWASSLPGKYAPESAGELIANCIADIISEGYV